MRELTVGVKGMRDDVVREGLHASPVLPSSRYLSVAAFLLLLAHVAVLVFLSTPVVPSNVCQLLAPALVVMVCCLEVRRFHDPYHRRMWRLLATAFAMWTFAQGYFLAVLLRSHVLAPFPSFSDLLWLLVAFPLLLVVVTRRSGSEIDWVSWIDAAQAAIFFAVLCVLVFSHSRTVPVWIAYDVQTATLCLAVGWRYFSTHLRQDRRFFLNLGVYLVFYGLMSSLANRVQQTPSKLADLADLCWSLPPLLFCVLVCRRSLGAEKQVPETPKPEKRFRKHLSGLSALGLSLMSLSAAAKLQSHLPVPGFCCLVLTLVLFAVRTSARETQLRDARDHMEHTAFHDSLTGLPNRARLLDAIRNLAAGRDTAGFALLYIDLDRFKAINDSFGHSFGDLLLLQVTKQLQSVSSSSVLARLGGDEFVLLIPTSDREHVLAKADAVLDQLRRPICIQKRSFYVTASIGIAFGASGSPAHDLLDDADCALYVAKSQGRNQVCLFHPSMHERAAETLSFETDLRGAVKNNELELYYQPIYSASHGEIIGAEALSRWNHPRRGFVPPASFIPVAEGTGLILELGKQVLLQACMQMQAWNFTYGTNMYVSVNLSARQLLDPDLLSAVQHSLERSGLPASQLKVEVTESVLLEEFDAVSSILESLRAMGVQIYLDDFGTGYSSLEYLLRLPFDVVKIDRSFVSAVHEDSKRLQMVRTIIQLAHALEKQTIAEGVETSRECKAVESMGCDAYQGYLFAKPLSIPELSSLLQQESVVLA